jgi:type VI secretion system protein ImpF
MSRLDSQAPLLPSVLDRLIDHQPDVSTEPAWQRAQNLREFELGVLRDVEALLNSRQTKPDLGEGFQHASQSVLTYGLPDFTSAGGGSRDDFERIRQAVELAIARFEPRLRHVRVTVREPGNEKERRLRMFIEAMLWIDPEPQPVTFDTIVHTQSGVCKVEPG